MVKKLNLVFYNGFNKPEYIDLKEVNISSNYLGDITDEFKEEYNFYVENWSKKDIIDNQPLFADFGVWVEPTLEQLREYNKSVLLDEDDYLENFVEGVN